MLREILKELDDKITAEDLDMMIEEIDSDGSGTVDFDGQYYIIKYIQFIVKCLFTILLKLLQNSWKSWPVVMIKSTMPNTIIVIIKDTDPILLYR